jgi:hypothetical protein
MTYGQAVQLYASITQGFYSDNVIKHGRQEQRQKLESALTAQDLKLVNKLRALYAARRDELSEIVQEVTGTPVWSPDPNYMPVSMFLGAKGGLATEARAWSPLAKALTPRVRNGKDFDESADVMAMLARSNENTARAIAFGVRGVQIRAILGRRAVQNAIVRFHGKEQLKRLMEQVNDHLMGVEPEHSASERMARTAMKVTTYTALSWNMLSALKQVASIPSWGMVLDNGLIGVVKNMASFDWDTARELADSDWFKARYGYGMTREIADIIADGKGNIISRVYQAGMQPLQFFDMLASFSVGTGFYTTTRDSLIDQGMDPAQAAQQAKTMTGILVEESQQSSRPENQPEALRRQGFASRLLYQFASSPMLQLSHEIQAAREWRAQVDPTGTMNAAQVIGKSLSNAANGIDDGRGKLVRTVIINHVILPALMTGVSTAFNSMLGDEPEKDDVLKELALQMAVGPFSRIVWAGSILEGFGKYALGMPQYRNNMVPAEGFVKAVSSIGMTAVDIVTLDWDKAQADLLKMIQSTGAPQRQAIKAWKNYSE